MAGDIVMVRMSESWQPGLGIRIYPAMVLYPNPGYGPGGLDVQVFLDPYYAYEDSKSNHLSVTRGDGPGQWQPKRRALDQQPLDHHGAR